MDARHRSIQIFGWLSAIVGFGLALLLIRGMFMGITRGFDGSPSAFLLLLAYLLFLALAVYIFTVGRRAISIAKGTRRPRARFGWGRMLLGAILIFATASNRFHIFPDGHVFTSLKYDNRPQTAAGNVTTIAILIGCVALILWGIWKGFRRQTIRPDFDS